jgi:hypothetical protein
VAPGSPDLLLFESLVLNGFSDCSLVTVTGLSRSDSSRVLQPSPKTDGMLRLSFAGTVLLGWTQLAGDFLSSNGSVQWTVRTFVFEKLEGDCPCQLREGRWAFEVPGCSSYIGCM